MPTKPMQSIAQQLNAAQVAISNTLADAEIQSLLDAYGYDADKLNEGKALYDVATSQISDKTSSAGAQRGATAQLQAAEQGARDAYQALSQIARAAFAKDKAKLAVLGLNRPAPRDTAGFIASANTLFNNALNDSAIRTALAAYKYTPAKLKSEQAKISAYDSANQTQEGRFTTATWTHNSGNFPSLYRHVHGIEDQFIASIEAKISNGHTMFTHEHSNPR